MKPEIVHECKHWDCLHGECWLCGSCLECMDEDEDEAIEELGEPSR